MFLEIKNLILFCFLLNSFVIFRKYFECYLMMDWEDTESSFWNVTSGLVLERISNASPTLHTSVNTDQENVIRMNSTRAFILPLWQKTIWAFAFSVIVLVAVVGNFMVFWSILAHRNMRTVTNYFLLNLSIADFMMATFNVIFSFIYMIEGHWSFGKLYCRTNNFIGGLTVGSSVFTLVAMCIDRYIAIIHPLRPRMSKVSAGVVIMTIWIMAGVLSIPYILFSETLTWIYPDDSVRTVCYLVWPDGPTAISKTDYRFNILFLNLTYVIPLILMGIAYTRMGISLWGSKAIGEDTKAQRSTIMSKQKIVKMFMTVVLLFAICWLPYHIYFIYTHHNKQVLRYKVTQHVYLAFYWLAMSNTIYNPIIYYLMNPRFKRYFRALIKCKCIFDKDYYNGYLDRTRTRNRSNYSSKYDSSRRGTTFRILAIRQPESFSFGFGKETSFNGANRVLEITIEVSESEVT
ncbi:Tachykinin-like peptides receptor 86C [Nymphon striatum]|nr:Tachykinin-like peptides receptor 86C [Nymphon striatum]